MDKDVAGITEEVRSFILSNINRNIPWYLITLKKKSKSIEERVHNEDIELIGNERKPMFFYGRSKLCGEKPK